MWFIKYKYLIFLVVLNLFANGSFAENDYIWNINESGLFDPSDSRYEIRDGSVEVCIGDSSALCPTGLGHLSPGRDKVEQIDLLFQSFDDITCRLYIAWQPGGSGIEQFQVTCNMGRDLQSKLIKASDAPYQTVNEAFEVSLKKGENALTLNHLSGDGLHFKYIMLSNSPEPPDFPQLNPKLKFPTLNSYQNECGQKGIMLNDSRLCMFAPAQKRKEAKAVFEYLIKAYDHLYNIVGMRPEYKLVIYHFPENNEHGWGGTSNCTIWYSCKNLDFESQNEWIQYKVPHLSGYIEEMAHNFVNATGAQFGWEMIGWNIGIITALKIAPNPALYEQMKSTRQGQDETFKRYLKAGCTFPSDLPYNQCDRIHAHILYLCEKRYGSEFWCDFFKEIRKERKKILEAAKLKKSDIIRNKKYQTTVECFDRLEGIPFKKILRKYQISLTTDVKSLGVKDPGWNRKLLSPEEIR